MIKISIHQEDKTTKNVCASNNRALKSMKKKLKELRGEVDQSRTIVRNFNNPLSIIDRTKQKISKDLQT